MSLATDTRPGDARVELRRAERVGNRDKPRLRDRKGRIRFGHLDTPALVGDDAGVPVYGLSVAACHPFEFFGDRVEAEFALFDVVEEEPELATELAVVEIEWSSVRVVARWAGSVAAGRGSAERSSCAEAQRTNRPTMTGPTTRE